MVAHYTVVRVLLAPALWGVSGGAAVVDFETVPTGTVYGSTAPDPHEPGEVVLTQPEMNGINMSVETYFLSQALSDFFTAEVVTHAIDGTVSNALVQDSIAVMFDFSGVGFPVSQVSLDYEDLGGVTNFAVNEEDIRILNPLTDLPQEVAPGVMASVEETRITLTSANTAISSLRIGGQELFLDNVTAVPDPGTGLLLGAGCLALLWRARRKRPLTAG